MGHAQSRPQRDAQQRRARRNRGTSGQSRSSSPAASSTNAENRGVADAHPQGGSRKRHRGSASPDPQTALTHQDRPLTQRRRTTQASSSSVTSDAITAAQSTAAASDAMQVDEVPSSSATSTSLQPTAGPQATANNATAAPSSQSDFQQRFNTIQSGNGSPSEGDSGATPPPYLDALREERERARRQILEALGAAAPAVAAASAPSTTDQLTTAPAPVPSTTPNTAALPSQTMASATIAALLGAMATGHAPPGIPGTPSLTGSATTTRSTAEVATAPATGTTSASGSRAQQQQDPSGPRSQAIRIPLQPEMINGTSMVVQGALVARTIPNRPASVIDDSAPTSATRQEADQQASSSAATAFPPAFGESQSSAGSSARRPDAAGSTPDGEDTRGAVTLEEQAVMLSRILGIAAAATAASLLNTSESHHVDPSLLQTSLRRPFERRMNQASTDRNERWLDDWQRSRPSTERTTSSGSGDDTSGQQQSGAGTVAGLGNGLRRRLSALSRRVSSSTLSSVPPNQDAPTSPSGTTAASATDTDAANTVISRQQEIIAHLLSAAEREAASQRLGRVDSAQEPSTRATWSEAVRSRSSSLSSSRPQTTSWQENSPRSSLSRLVRSTIGTFMHPGRLLPGRSRSDGPPSASSESTRDGWTTAGRASGSTAAPSSEFPLGSNDVAGTLRQVRNGVLPDGVPGSFGSFLNHLVRDLMAAVQLMRPSSEVPLERSEAQTTNYFEHATHGDTTSGAEVLDGEGGEATATASSTTTAGTSHAQAQQGYTSNSGPNEARDSSQTNTERVDGETQARRERDFQNGNLSFFRLFRFDPVAPSQLVPCIVVGVRSLNVTERFDEEMLGARAAGPGREFNGSRQQTWQPTTLGSDRPTTSTFRQRAQSEGAQAAPTTGASASAPSAPSAPSDGEAAGTNGEELPASRFMLFVSGGRYPPNHPLLTSNPATAGRDLMILMDLLSTMQAMQHKPSTVTQQEIDASELRKIKGSEVAALVRSGDITENMAERCLVCLEDWKDDDGCRIMACKHAFHTFCVDKWMSKSSNTCPMCRRQGVAKDGRHAGQETADSQRAAQA
ncbi:uncharacterized protein UHOD_08549 [Ustilago sp. UG-2017b]|nr:uncharacterized protein UHOD_08549 [Ustilago sp. UG-2017b]